MPLFKDCSFGAAAKFASWSLRCCPSVARRWLAVMALLGLSAGIVQAACPDVVETGSCGPESEGESICKTTYEEICTDKVAYAACTRNAAAMLKRLNEVIQAHALAQLDQPEQLLAARLQQEQSSAQREQDRLTSLRDKLAETLPESRLRGASADAQAALQSAKLAAIEAELKTLDLGLDAVAKIDVRVIAERTAVNSLVAAYAGHGETVPFLLIELQQAQAGLARICTSIAERREQAGAIAKGVPSRTMAAAALPSAARRVLLASYDSAEASLPTCRTLLAAANRRVDAMAHGSAPPAGAWKEELPALRSLEFVAPPATEPRGANDYLVRELMIGRRLLLEDRDALLPQRGAAVQQRDKACSAACTAREQVEREQALMRANADNLQKNDLLLRSIINDISLVRQAAEVRRGPAVCQHRYCRCVSPRTVCFDTCVRQPDNPKPHRPGHGPGE